MENHIRLTLIIITVLLIGITIGGFVFSIKPEIIKETKIIYQTDSYNVYVEEIQAPSAKFKTIGYVCPPTPPKPLPHSMPIVDTRTNTA